jgi:radical SAM superfamily enzyme YgiQ (UPF0313 family)
MQNFSTWYNNKRSMLTGGGLWLRGSEMNVSFGDSRFPILIVRLSTYRDTALSITHASLYQIATTMAGAAADFAYLPPPKDGRIMKRDSVPWLTGTTTKLSWESFGLIAVSNSVVQELINLPVMLEASGIEKSFKERIDDERIPLIVLGGANAGNTAVLIHDKSPVDAIFAGEDYAQIAQIFTIIKEGRRQNIPKREILNRLSSVPGVIIPAYWDTPSRKSTTVKITKDISRQILSENPPVFYSESKSRSGIIHISEGCQFFCSFCAESWQRKPYREIPADEIIAKARAMKQACGFESIDLYSFNFNIHSEIDRIVTELSMIFRSVGLKSQRFDMIAEQPDMIPFMIEAGKSSITCGLEGISGRLRNYLCKSLKTDNLMKSIEIIMNSTLRELKIFLIATGKESEDDYNEFTELVGYIASFNIKNNKKKRINFSLTPLVRFPHTPLETEGAPEIDAIQSIVNRISSICRDRGFEFREASSAYEYFVSQIMLRGDSRVYSALLKTIEKERFVYYDDVGQKFADTFRRLMKNDGIDVKNILSGDDSETGYAAKNRSFNLGIKEDFRNAVADDCKAFRYRPSCAGMAMPGKCQGCGACDADNMQAITAARVHHFDAKAIAEIKRGAQRSEIRLYVSVSLPDDMLLMKQYAGGIIARAIMQSYPETLPLLRSLRYERSENNDQIYSIVILPEMKQMIDTIGAQAFLEAANKSLTGIELKSFIY